MIAILARLSDQTTWRQIRHPPFKTESEAQTFLAHYTHLQGIPHRFDAFHGMQPLRLAKARELGGPPC